MATPIRNDPRMQLEPPSNTARIVLFVLAVGLPLMIISISVALGLSGNRPMHLMENNLALTLASTFFSALLVVVLWWFVDLLIKRHRLTIGKDGIEVATTFYSRKLSLDQLLLDQACVVNLEEHPELKPLFKTNGASIPGDLQSGWFRLRDRSKAFVARVGGNRVLWIPTTAGYGLLLQPKQPQVVLEYLQSLKAG